MDVPATASGAVKCDRKATIALYRPNGEVAEIHAAIGNCNGGDGGGEPAKPQCADGKDDDGDGMIDDHFAEGATDPDPGCTSTTDTSENSELLAPATARSRIGLLERRSDRRVRRSPRAAARSRASGCTRPAPLTDCGYQLGEEGTPTQCEIVRETGGTMFAKTTLPLVAVAPMTAPGRLPLDDARR